VRYWSQDESRMGLHTIQRRKLTGYGIKPQGKVQWEFTYLWLYGAVESLTGASFFVRIQVVRIQVFDWGTREGMKKPQEWADIASRKKAIALLP